MYTGTFGRINGVDYLVKLAARMRDIDPQNMFLLVGDGVEYDTVRLLALNLGLLDKNIFIWQSIPKVQIASVLSAATVCTSLVVPLRALWNNSANKFFDSLAAGKPIAINYGGWQADILLESGAGVVLSDSDPLEGAKQLAEFIADKQKLEQAKRASRHLAQTQFNREQMARKLENILRNVVMTY